MMKKPITALWSRLADAVVIPLLIALVFSQSTLASNSMPASANKFFTTEPQASLEVAVRSGDAAGIARAIAAGASVAARGKQDVTPLMIAVDSQRLESVVALLAAGADPNAKAIDGHSPVSLATESYRAKPHGEDILSKVMQSGGNPDARRPDHDPVVMRFINDHDIDHLKRFKALGANLDVLDRSDDPLITTVAMGQDWDVVWAMIELGTKFDYEGGQSRRPLSRALSLPYPTPDSPLYQYKLKVWQLLKDRGLPVKPLQP